MFFVTLFVTSEVFWVHFAFHISAFRITGATVVVVHDACVIMAHVVSVAEAVAVVPVTSVAVIPVTSLVTASKMEASTAELRPFSPVG